MHEYAWLYHEIEAIQISRAQLAQIQALRPYFDLPTARIIILGNSEAIQIYLEGRFDFDVGRQNGQEASVVHWRRWIQQHRYSDTTTQGLPKNRDKAGMKVMLEDYNNKKAKNGEMMTIEISISGNTQRSW